MSLSMDERRCPLDLAAELHRHGKDFSLLFSGLRTSYSGARSLLAFDVLEQLAAERFDPLQARLSDETWFGWLGYGLRHALESLPVCPPSFIDLPSLCMTRYATVETFDTPSMPLPAKMPDALAGGCAVASLASNMRRDTYLAHVAATVERIHAGQFYQANITRKFYGTLHPGHDVAVLFIRLVHASPAPYSAWLRHGDTHILSSSPELFLKVEPDGRIFTRPIKGSAPAHTPPEALQRSEKDRAENLMIADLMRNDFSRVAADGSVEVSELFGVDSFTTIHHMASTIEARLAEGRTAMDAVRACFPPGSMTGAPKIAAMRWCTEVEALERGIYSGALGWIGPHGCELSVIIRTLVIQGNHFEFQVGGGIVADSDPEAEWQETMTKARGIAQALGLEMSALEAL